MKSKLFFIALFGIIFLLPSISEAAFNLSGSTITQTGTDTDLSGLSAIAGVTTLAIGSGVDGRTIYSIGDRNLVIQGDLDINPELEAVFTNTNSPRSVVDLQNGATLTINGEVIENGVTRYSEQLFLWTPYQNGSCCNNYGLRVRNGGTLNWTGGAMRIGSSLSFDPGSTINTEGATLYQDKNSDNQLRQSTNNWTSNSFRFNGNDITFIAIPAQFNNYEPLGARGALGFSGSTPNIDFPLSGYSSNGSSDSDIRHWQGSRPILTNSQNGTDLKVVPHISGNGSSYAVAIVRQEVQVNTLDINANPIEDVQVYLRDTDNGNREVYNREGYTVDATNDIVYQQTTNVSGDTAIFEVTTGFNIVNTGSAAGVNTGDYAWDYRGKNNDSSDLFDIHLWSYEHRYAAREVELKGVDTKEVTTNLLPDSNISESDKTTVDAYTSIDTLDQLYDRGKSWKIDNVGLEYPAIDGQLMIGNGASLDLGNRNLVIDAGAAQAFDVDTGTDTITINSALLGEGDIFTSFTTTGLVTYQNAAVQDTDYTDNTGFYPVDSQDPVVTITSQIPTKIDNQTITVDIQATDNRSILLDDVQVSLANTTAGVANFICLQTNTKQVDCTLDVLSSGNVEMRAVDARGLLTTELDPGYIIDTKAPDITAALDTTVPFTTNTPEVTFSATDNISAAGDIDFTVSIDDGPFVTQSSPYTPTLVGDRHIIVIKAADELGNESEFSFVYTPILTITAPTTTSNVDITDTTITTSSINDITDVTITGAGSTFVCAPDPTPASPSSGPVTCTGVITTTGTLNISATDTLITDSADLGYTIERTPPVITITAPTTSGTDGIIDTTITVTDDVAVDANDVFIDGSSSSAARLFNCSQTSTTQVDCTIDIASSGDLIILARDRSDNESMETQSYTVIPSGFSSASSGRGGGGSNSLMICTSDPTAANYYGGDLDLDAFRFYKIVKRCIYGDQPQEVVATEIVEEVDQQPIEISYEKPQCTINYYRLIKRGMRGTDVKQVQRCMNSLGYTSGPEDGIYGPLTYRGITAYQRAQRLQYIDGIVGPETSGSLNDLGDVTVVGA